MSRTLNRVQLIGRLGQDPQMRYTQSGTPMTTFSLATNRQWQGKDGTMQEETDWHSVVAWDKLAQICSEHLTKGRLVYIEGRLQNRSWEQDGQTRYKTEIVASDMLILDSRGGAYNESPSPVEEPVEIIPPPRRNTPVAATSAAQSRPEARTQQPKPAPARRPAVIEVDDDPEDLPF